MAHCLCRGRDRTKTLQAEFLVVPKEKLITLCRPAIDRIDFHEASRTMRILDYKTRTARPNPTRPITTRKRLVDLQLPLYTGLSKSSLPKLNRRGSSLAYFQFAQESWMKPALPRRRGTPRLCWMPEMSPKTSFEAACDNEILSSHHRPAPKYSEDFAAICLDDQFRRAGP